MISQWYYSFKKFYILPYLSSFIVDQTENSGGVPQDIVISAASADPVIRANSIRRVIQILNSGAEGLSAGEVVCIPVYILLFSIGEMIFDVNRQHYKMPS